MTLNHIQHYAGNFFSVTRHFETSALNDFEVPLSTVNNCGNYQMAKLFCHTDFETTAPNVPPPHPASGYWQVCDQSQTLYIIILVSANVCDQNQVIYIVLVSVNVCGQSQALYTIVPVSMNVCGQSQVIYMVLVSLNICG